MEDLIFFIKNIFNPHKFEFCLASVNSFYPDFTQKELNFIMYAKSENVKNIFNKEDNQLITQEEKNKYTIMDRLRGFFSKTRRLPDPNSSKEYTMDEWIDAQKNPVSRLFNNIARSTASAVKNMLSKKEISSKEITNQPTTPSQNFEMPVKNSTDKTTSVIIPPFNKTKTAETPFVPLENNTVETQNLTPEELETTNSESSLDGTSDSKPTKKSSMVASIKFDSKGLEKANSSLSQTKSSMEKNDTFDKSKSNDDIEK